jgi:hypothetical protein
LFSCIIQLQSRVILPLLDLVLFSSHYLKEQ